MNLRLHIPEITQYSVVFNPKNDSTDSTVFTNFNYRYVYIHNTLMLLSL